MRSTLAALLVLAAATMAWIPSGATAAESATLSTSLNANGSGFLIANSQTNPETEVWVWQACSADLSTCSPFGSGRSISTDGAQPNTRFKATSSYGAIGTSSLWLGGLRPLSSPRISGLIKGNQRVTPGPGRWRGGWSDDYDIFQLAACKSPKGLHCTTLTDLNYPEKCPRGAAVLDPIFTGSYLRVADQRIGTGTVFLDFAVGSPYEGKLWTANQSTSVAIIGRIAKATGPRASSCGPPPLTEAP
jgi:hypothetical protein